MSDRGPWHVHGVNLPDGTAPRDWWIADGRWHDAAVPGARQLPGGWVLPGGLVDAHVHLTMNFGRVMPHPDGSPALVAANHAAQRRAGVLAVRDAGCAWGGIPDAPPTGPRLQRAGSIMAPAGRGYPNVCRSVAADQLVDVALAEIAAGASWVKVLGDFPGPDGNWFTAPPNYPCEALTALVREAHAAGARVMAHSTGLAAPDLVAAGVDSIEHGMVLSESLVAEMADRGIAWSLTLSTAEKHIGPLAKQDTPVGAYIRGRLDHVRGLLPLAVARGVPLLAGADEIGMGVVSREVACLTGFGLTGAQALAAASTSARAWLGFPAPRTGEPADLVTFAADPRHDVSVLDRPAAIVFDGVLVTDA